MAERKVFNFYVVFLQLFNLKRLKLKQHPFFIDFIQSPYDDHAVFKDEDFPDSLLRGNGMFKLVTAQDLVRWKVVGRIKNLIISFSFVEPWNLRFSEEFLNVSDSEGPARR